MILAVNGTLMRGLELNDNMLQARAVFVRDARTAPCYRMWSIGDNYPAMQRDDDHGCSLTLELWSLEPQGLMSILDGEPPGLALGQVLLDDGSTEYGVLGEASICIGQREITSFGGWREYCDQ